MTGYLFPGQGSQYVGMGKDLHASIGACRQIFERADTVLGMPLSRIMFEGPEEVLRETRNAQPAILTHSIAVWMALGERSRDVDCAAAGHSLGEYSAYVAAGSFRFEDAVGIVRRRGELMYAAGLEHPGAMAAVLGADEALVSEVCAATDGVVCPANFNSPTQIVISGESQAVTAACKELSTRGAKRIVPLEVSGAFHSPLMETAAAGLDQVLAAAEIRDAGFPVYANASAAPVVAADQIRTSLVRQLLNPVLWAPTVRQLVARGIEDYLEIGPGKVLKGLLRATDRSLECRTLGTADEVKAFSQGR